MRKTAFILLLALLIPISIDAAKQQTTIDSKWDINYGKNGIPSIIGYKEPLRADDIDIATKDFLNINKALFDIDTKNIEVAKKHQGKIKNKDFKTIVYTQIYNGLPVFNSHVVSASINNNLVLLRNKYYPDISINTQPSISQSEAFDIVKQLGDKIIAFRSNQSTSNVMPKISSAKKITLGILPLEKAGSYEHLLSYKIDLPLVDNHEWSFFIEANTGNILDIFDNVVYEDVIGHITGMVYPEYSGQEKINVDFSSDYVYISPARSTSDAQGRYAISQSAGIATLTSKLEGPWVKVLNARQPAVAYSTTVTVPSIHDWNWQNYDTSYKQEESNVFYHTNIVHDYATSIGVPEMNLQMLARVNIDSSCNAYYVARSINFYRASSSCDATSLDSDIIYHEYGHGINDELITVSWPYQDETGNMNEGLADYWACTINNNPCMGEYFFLGSQCLRRCDTNDRYPEDFSPEPHSGAQIISAPFWELRQLLGKQVVDQMLTNALRLQPTSFSELLDSVLIVDDDNQDLSDGTPNILAICSSFNNHGILSGSCAGYTQIPLALITNPKTSDRRINEKNTVSILGTAYNSIGSQFQLYTLEYGQGSNPSTWNLISSGSIPITNDLLGLWDIANLDSGDYTLRMSVVDSSSQTQYVNTHYIDKEIMPGWPKLNTGWSYSPIVLADMDNDGKDELIVSYSSNTAVYKYDGSLWLSIPASDYLKVPAIGDINNDGFNDIVINDFVSSTSYNLYIYYGPFPTTNYRTRVITRTSTNPLIYSSSPSLYDLNNDGILEIILAGEFSKIYVLDSDLNNFNSQWPRDLLPGDYVVSNPVVGDLDYDGVAEILVLTKQEKIYAWKPTGDLMPGSYPISLVSTDSIDFMGVPSPAIADVDNDGTMEIFAVSQDYFYGFNHDGQDLPGWPIQHAFPVWQFIGETVIADLDDDRVPEVIFQLYSGDKQVYKVSGSRILLYNEPSYYAISSIVVNDIDNNGKIDLIYPDSKGKLAIMEDSANIKRIELYDRIFTPAAISDADGDGDVNIAIKNDMGTIYLWDMSGSVSNKKEWSQFHHDPLRTGNYNFAIFISKIKNNAQSQLNGFLTLKVQKNNNGFWEDYLVLQNMVYHTISPRSSLSLVDLWNSQGISLLESGSYRAAAEFTDASGNILQSTSGQLAFYYPFSVTSPQRIQQPRYTSTSIMPTITII